VTKGGEGEEESMESFSSVTETIHELVQFVAILLPCGNHTAVSSVGRDIFRRNGGGRDQGRETEKWASLEGEATLSLLCEVATRSYVAPCHDIRGEGTNSRAEEICEGAGESNERREASRERIIETKES
jgi:hypothetical protein